MWGQVKEETNEIHFHQIRVGEILGRQLKNPLLVVLGIATFVAYLLGQSTNATVILVMMSVSVALGFWNEWQSEKTIIDLLKKVTLSAILVRNGIKDEVPAKTLKVDDIVFLSAGAVVPADIELISANDLEIDESALTGESRYNVRVIGETAYLGTVVKSGFGTGRVIRIGIHTQFGKMSVDLSGAKPETEFQRGLAQFGSMLARVIALMSIGLFFLNYLMGKPVVDSLLFSLAIAIGLTPELLPVVVTVSLSHGARRLAKKEVIVKRLVAIEDLGNMEVLCTDKTGTLTEGKIVLTDFVDIEGRSDHRTLINGLAANLAVTYRGLYGDAIDTAIWEYKRLHDVKIEKIERVFESPFDFIKRYLFVVIEEGKKRKLIVKGSPESVLNLCKATQAEKKQIMALYERYSRDGLRVVAIAEGQVASKDDYTDTDVAGLKWGGYLVFSDIPKPSAKDAIERLANLGVMLKVVTGDNEMVTQNICRQLELPDSPLLTGAQVEEMTTDELRKVVWQTKLFVRMSPSQKERVIGALQHGGHSVAYLGDGVNDGPALRLADVGISVSTGVDIAKDVASIVLLRKSLSVIAEGVAEGRRIFTNTIKYILMGTSSNFGNMFSAAGASLFLPFLPMTPTQLLLANSLYDVSQLSIPTDTVDAEAVTRPKRWDIKLIYRYMWIFGIISSVYDFMTYGVLWFVYGARGASFQTGWFVESLLTQIAVVFIIRTGRRFYKSRPSNELLITCLGIMTLVVLIPWLPIADVFGMVKLPLQLFGVIFVMVATYLMIVEKVKTLVIKNV